MGKFENTDQVSIAVHRLATQFASAGANEASARLEAHLSAYWTTTTEFLVELLTLLDALESDTPESLRGPVADLQTGVRDLAQLS